MFLALNLGTPVCRDLRTKGDRSPREVRLPLRVLVAVATPIDKPSAKAKEEVAAIRGLLEPLSGPGGLLKLDIYEQPTRDELAERLKSSDIFHFIGHGGFAVMGSDPTSQAHISLIRPDTNESDYLFASDLANMLNNTEVQLVVFTACTSSESTPDEGPFRIGAFDGMAQRLLSGVRGVTAAVAMQFDMEAEAAVAFSKKLYKHLLDADKTLAEVVTLARSAVSICKGVGHRAWVTPTVYCRCEGGHVFRLATPGPVGPGPVTPPVTREYDVSGSWKYRCKGINRDLEHGGTCRIEFTHASFGVPCKVIGRRLWVKDFSPGARLPSGILTLPSTGKARSALSRIAIMLYLHIQFRRYRKRLEASHV